MTIAAYWMLSENFGDRITPWLIGKIRGEAPAWVPMGFDAEHYVVCGSILNHANAHAMVWGAGLANLADVVNNETTIFAVRGPLSRARALSCGAKCPPVYGDPALLLPRFYDVPKEKKYRLGYVPHYTDQFRVFERYAGEHIVNILGSVEKVIDDIRSCERIVSSALHGLVIAHAYGIPAAWVKWGDSIGGDVGTKYRDFLASIGLDIPYPLDRRESKDEIPLDAFARSDGKRLKDIQDTLWGVCPIRRSGE